MTLKCSHCIFQYIPWFFWHPQILDSLHHWNLLILFKLICRLYSLCPLDGKSEIKNYSWSRKETKIPQKWKSLTRKDNVLSIATVCTKDRYWDPEDVSLTGHFCHRIFQASLWLSLGITLLQVWLIFLSQQEPISQQQLLPVLSPLCVSVRLMWWL